MTEWNGDSQWWQNGDPVQIKNVDRALIPSTGGAASTAAASNAAVDGQSTQESSKHSLKAANAAKKKYMTDLPVSRQPWFEFLPAKASVKPLLRPKFPCSQKNQGSVDKQAAKEQQVAEGRAARYMQQAATLTCHHHHHTLQLGPEGAEPQAHVVLGDKGKHRPVGTRSGYLFDPITSTSRPVTAPSRATSRAGLLTYKGSSILQGTSGDDQHTLNDSTCGQRDSSSSGSTGGGSKGHDTLFFAGSLYHTYNGELINLTSRPGTASGSPGRYNPLTHTWAEPPSDTAAYAKWQQDGESNSLSGRRPLSAGRCRDRTFTADKDSVGGLLRQHSSSGRSSSSSSSGGGGEDSARSVSTGRRKVRSMDTWGTYDVIRNEWVVPPADARYINAEMSPFAKKAEPLQSSGDSRPQRKAITPPSQGVYDPIKAEWKVLPQQSRAAHTLDFAPRMLFTEKAFVKR